jgi:hypothetical protein
MRQIFHIVQKYPHFCGWDIQTAAVAKYHIFVRLCSDLTANSVAEYGPVFRKGGDHLGQTSVAGIDNGFLAFLTFFTHGGGVPVTDISPAAVPDFFTERAGIFRIGQYFTKVAVIYGHLHSGKLVESLDQRQKCLPIDLNIHVLTALWIIIAKPLKKSNKTSKVWMFSQIIYTKKYTICGGDMLECKKQKLEVRL